MFIHASISEVPWVGQRGWGSWQRFGTGDLFGARDGAVCGLALQAVEYLAVSGGKSQRRAQRRALGAHGLQSKLAGVLLAANKKPDGTARAVPSGEILLCQRKRSPLSGPDSGRKRPG